MLISSYNLILFTFLSLTLFCSCSLTPNTTREQAEQTIQSSTTFLYLVYDEIHVRELQTTHDPVLHDKYKDCGVLYTAAVNDLIESTDILNSGTDYQKLPRLASNALEQVENCDKIFTPAGNETEFKSLSEKAINVCNNVLAVVKSLAPGET